MGTNYVIECTVTELTKEKSRVAVKIVGLEGYAIKHDDKTYNIFCPKNMLDTKDKLDDTENCFQGYIVDSKVEFTLDNKFKTILTQAFMHGKKIRLTIELKDGKKLEEYICDNDNNPIPIQSVTLLQK